MFAREGYVPISRLWRDFEREFLPLCRTHALACLRSDPHGSEFMFGTALDLCEDVFLKVFETFTLSLVPFEGEVIHVDPVNAYSGATLLLKKSAFESVQISMFSDEAGRDGEWLRQMGSTAFRAADPSWLWPDDAGRDTGAELEAILFADAFHTLPVRYERSSFTIAEELPPWCSDLREEGYAHNLWQKTRGSSICLSDESVQYWKKALSLKSVDTVLRGLLPGFELTPITDNSSSVGRPNKVLEVERAYQELELVDENLTRKEELRRIEAHLKSKISPSTLDRVRRNLGVTNAKDTGGDD